LPEYVVIERMGPDHAPQFTAEVRISGLAAARGQGTSKRIAEQAAATNFLEREGILKGSAHV
jgi:ribonuclease III